MEQYLGPNALADEEEDKAFHARHAAQRLPTLPAHITTKQLKDTITDACGVTLHLACKEINKLKTRIKELEARPALDYTGLHEPGRSYRKGQAVSHGGSVWIAMHDMPNAPGTPNSGWQLAVKRGRDGKDGKVARKNALA
jgi:hypothetical protein